MTLCLLITAAVAGAETTAPADTTLRVGSIELQMERIFTAAEVDTARGLNHTLRKVMNGLHFDTRPWVVRQELLFAEGDPFRPELLEESTRNLRSLGILNRVRVAAVDTTEDGRVAVRVRTRETWTLGLGLNFALASSGKIRWNLSLTEKNFLGTGLLVRGSVGHDLNAGYGRLYFRQNRFLRSPVTVELNLDHRTDGHDRWFAISVPFRADDQRWALSLEGWSQSFETRWYLSNAGPAGADPAREQSLYAKLPRQYEGLRVESALRLSPEGRGRIWRVGPGVQITERSYDLDQPVFTLSDGRSADLSFLAEPGQPLARDSGTRVYPYLWLRTHGRRWAETRYLRRYGNREDIPLDAVLELRTGPSGHAVGSNTGYGERWSAHLGASNYDRTGRHFWFQSISADADFGNAEDRHHLVDALLGSYVRFGPPERPFTVKTFVEGVHAEGQRGDDVVVLGLDRGLRTLDVDGMAGERLLRWSCELGRVLTWVPLDIVQTGWGVYYTGGLARFPDETRRLDDARHEIGVGLRLGGTRSGTSDLARVDLTYDLTGTQGIVITTVSRGYF